MGGYGDIEVCQNADDAGLVYIWGSGRMEGKIDIHNFTSLGCGICGEAKQSLELLLMNIHTTCRVTESTRSTCAVEVAW